MSARRVATTDGITLAVDEHGDASRPTVLAVHGYPDNRHVWDGVAEALTDRFHVVTYDVRGCGGSDVPTSRAAYRQAQLTADLLAVADAVSPDAPVHLLAHDWGSIQSWAALAQAPARFASFTSVSGPSLDHAGDWLRRGHRHPRAAVRQLAHSYYIGLFQLPALPELAARRGVLDRIAGAHEFRTTGDKVNGIQLYRANARSLAAPKPQRITVPTQVVVPVGDPFVTVDLAIGAPRDWVDDLTVRQIDGEHWVVTAQPQVIAGLAAEFADKHAVTGALR